MVGYKIIYKEPLEEFPPLDLENKIYYLMDFIYLQIKPISIPFKHEDFIKKYLIEKEGEEPNSKNILYIGLGNCYHYCIVFCDIINNKEFEFLNIDSGNYQHTVIIYKNKIYDPTLNVWYNELSNKSDMFYHNNKVNVEKMINLFGQENDNIIYVDKLLNPYTRWKYRFYVNYTLENLLKNEFILRYRNKSKSFLECDKAKEWIINGGK